MSFLIIIFSPNCQTYCSSCPDYSSLIDFLRKTQTKIFFVLHIDSITQRGENINGDVFTHHMFRIFVKYM